MRQLNDTREEMEKLGKDMANTFKDCFTSDTVEGWLRHFAEYRFNTISAINKDDYGIDISEANKEVFIKSFVANEKINIANKRKEQKKLEKETKDKKKKGDHNGKK